MEIQTRSYEGAIRNFGTLREALDYAKTFITDQIELNPQRIIKISFPLGKERVRLIWDDVLDEWILEMMDDAVNEILTERQITT